MNANKFIIKELIKVGTKKPPDLALVKRKVAKIYKISCPGNIQLLRTYHKMLRNKSIKKSRQLETLLKTRPIRSLSGIVNVSVLTKPYPCPGKCLYCPKEKGIPKSYLSGEPAVERAKRLGFNPYLQVKKRLEMLELEGHPIDKVEIRTVGGTWSYYPKKYQIWFVKRCFDACNKKSVGNLKEAQRLNEKAKCRIVGLSVETRPDFINISEIESLRNLGVTMVELGIQSIYDSVLKLNRRGHTIKETVSATRLLKNAGFKVLYQMMPNLPGSNPRRDLEMFKKLFSGSDFQPDLLKIYPCLLLKEAPLFKVWKKGKYKPYREKQLINLLKSIKRRVPYYVRIQRIQRDIPYPRIVAGPVKSSNLRQILARLSKKEGWKCKCIRCREVKEDYDPKEKVNLFRQEYLTSGGKEIFLSFEDKKRTKLYSLLRLRIPSQYRENGSRGIMPVLEGAAIIREVHTYGQLHPLQKTNTGDARVFSPQHKGLGKRLIKEAERIAKKEFGLKKIAVISGAGVRNYFREMGYGLKETYMVKSL